VKKYILLIIILFTLVGCAVKSNSNFVNKGKKSNSLSYESCIKEAKSKWEGGGYRYAGYECKKLFLGYVLIQRKTFLYGIEQ
jgi:hypothetical protein